MSDATDRLSAALAGRYTIERGLGQGGMATVYLAHDLKHDRDVAIKVLHADLGAALGADRFLSEIRTTARLQHPHILPLLDSGDADGLLYYVMPLVTGETLRSRLERERQLPIDDAVLIAREVADALGYAHGLGVIHRDIKPENILLQGGHALVADFGIALAVQSAGGARMTQTGLSLGTPQYMSPEQAMGERTIDARSDIYALGAVTYEMLTGDPPFTGSSVQAIVAKVMTERPTPPHVLRDTIPQHVEHAVLTALAKLPADRFASAAEFGEALRLDSGARTSRSLPSQPHRPFSGRSLAYGSALLIGGMAAGAAIRSASAPRPKRSVITMTSIVAPAGGVFAEERSLALSPNGRQLAFVLTAEDGARTLWLRSLDKFAAEAIPGSTGARAPFWSPDGHALGYFADGFLVIRDEHGETRNLCPAAIPTGGSWSASGEIVFSDMQGLSIVSANGGSCRVLMPRGKLPQLRGSFLPDSRRILVSRGTLLDMIAIDMTGRVIRTIPVRTIEFAVTPQGYLVTHGPDEPGAVDAQRIDLGTLTLQGRSVRVVTDVRAQSGLQTFAVSSDGDFVYLPGGVDLPYLVYDAGGRLLDTVRVSGTWSVATRPVVAGPPTVAVAGNISGLWLYDLDANRATRLPIRATLLPGDSGYRLGPIYPVFNHDGSRLAYGLTNPARCRLVERDLATGAERAIGTDQPSTQGAGGCPQPMDWSPDGRMLLVRRDTTLTFVALDGSATPDPIVRPGRVWEGRFAPDGHEIAYAADENGRAEVYVRSLPSGVPVRVSIDGGRWPAWVGDGRHIAFVTPDGRVQEAAISTAPGGPAPVAHTLFTIPTWRRSLFEDGGVNFAVVPKDNRYIVRQSTSGVALAYIQHWPLIFSAADSSGHAGSSP